MSKAHFYKLTIQWTGNNGTGTSDYRSYHRTHIISGANKPDILGSSDPAFRGNECMYNPEELLVASLSSCHMLWFLHLCADNGIVVVDYVDSPIGIMEEVEDGNGKFKEVVLNPLVTVTEESSLEKLNELHRIANERCFIANSVNFSVAHRPVGKI